MVLRTDQQKGAPPAAALTRLAPAAPSARSLRSGHSPRISETPNSPHSTLHSQHLTFNLQPPTTPHIPRPTLHAPLSTSCQQPSTFNLQPLPTFHSPHPTFYIPRHTLHCPPPTAPCQLKNGIRFGCAALLPGARPGGTSRALARSLRHALCFSPATPATARETRSMTGPSLRSP